MAENYTLFEISWEICNKVGGIHTVISTKARSLVERFGDDYVAVGPWLLTETETDVPFDEESGFESFIESCRDMGIPVRVGRWRIPGRPRTILIEFSRLFEHKDDMLAELWENFEVDSISGDWDYVEPVLFGNAAGRVIERWWEEYIAPKHRRAVVHAHEWMTGSSLLYLQRAVPGIGTTFTTHATMLGRSLSSLGHSPEDGLGDKTVDLLAEEYNVVAKHSLEGSCVREADAFTTVSEITAREAELLHRRAPDPITPNGIDLSVVDEIAGETGREEAREILTHTASRFFGEDVSDAAFLCVSGRYEFHNKGIDVLLDSLAKLNEREGRRVVLFALIPAGNSGVRSEFLDRSERDPGEFDGPLGIATHNLFDAERDPIGEHCAKLGLDNSPEARVRVIHVPIYLETDDGFLGLPYEAVLRAMDLSCFPSYYEPWGYTPQESLAVGVPTITTDYAGFGRWASSQGLGTKDGVTVLVRQRVEYAAVAELLAAEIERFLSEGKSAAELARICRATAERASWKGFIPEYHAAYAQALEAVQGRLEGGVPYVRRKPRRLLPVQVVPRSPRPHLIPFDVSARLPEELADLERLAQNYWWCWDPEGTSLFADLSPRAWKAARHNPVALLKRAYPEDLSTRAADSGYLERLRRVTERLDAYLAEPTSLPGKEGEPEGVIAEHPVAYFCAEFGVHESLRVYSGGLGILAGDHLKSASDLALPLVAVGLFYRMGYMGQRLSPSGEQIAVDIENDPRTLPMTRVLDPRGEPLEICLSLPGRELYLRAWKVAVGRVPLYLLDTDTPSNREEDRDIGRNLYGGDQETRLLQEIVLGRGGVRLLRSLGITPSVYHMNEGHAAFLTLERVGELAHKEGLTFEEAREFVRATTLFTTHTPVPAGHDRFGEDLVRRYFSDVADWVGVPWERFFAFGHTEDEDEETDGEFNMTYLAMYFSSSWNGVSQLHGVASRNLLHEFWPSLLESEVPVATVTNGIHLATWTHPEVAAALGASQRAVQPADFEKPLSARALNGFWEVRRKLKAQLFERVKKGLERSFLGRGDSPLLLGRMLDGLREDALVIGFARRFAPYKRALLAFQDKERLRAILGDEERPVLLLVAGKAHPADGSGKALLKEIVELARSDDFVGKVVFLEDYDVELARALVQGVDVWLNTPTRLLEASGTSGMKAAANGVLNLSIGDGWWPEAYDGENGWVIGEGRAYEDQELQDQLDAGALYRLLQEELVPLYFDRDKNGVPRRWLERVRNNLATIPPYFNTDRMVGEYVEASYAPLGRAFADLSRDKKWRLKSLVKECHRIRKGFESLRIASVHVGDLTDLRSGDPVAVRAELELGVLKPEDIVVELVLGHAHGEDDLLNMAPVPLAFVQTTDDGTHVFEGVHRVERTGSFSYGVRVRARDDHEPRGALRALVLWA